jgi:hypothetical protein
VQRIVRKLWPKHKISVNVFSASAGAVGTDQAKALTLIASGAAAAFCFFSAEGKEKRNIESTEYEYSLIDNFSPDTTSIENTKPRLD